MPQNTETLNKFIQGVNTDIAEDSIPDGFLTGGHNIKLSNNDNKQGIVQKQEGYIKIPDGYPSNLKPLAAKEFNDVIYFVSYDISRDDGTIEYGSYPSADLTTIDQATGECVKVFEYAPLPNFKFTGFVLATPSVFNLLYAGGTANITNITTHNVPWIVDSISESWITTQSTGGNNGDDLLIDVGFNNSPQGRQGAIQLITTDPEAKTTIIDIHQGEDTRYISTSRGTIYLDSDGLPSTVTKATIVTWGPQFHEYSKSDSWFSYTPDADQVLQSSGTQLTFSANVNTVLQARSGSVTFQTDEQQYPKLVTINVEQAREVTKIYSDRERVNVTAFTPSTELVVINSTHQWTMSPTSVPFATPDVTTGGPGDTVVTFTIDNQAPATVGDIVFSIDGTTPAETVMVTFTNS